MAHYTALHVNNFEMRNKTQQMFVLSFVGRFYLSRVLFLNIYQIGLHSNKKMLNLRFIFNKHSISHQCKNNLRYGFYFIFEKEMTTVHCAFSSNNNNIYKSFVPTFLFLFYANFDIHHTK